MFLPTKNVRLGLLFDLGARFNLAFDAEVSQQVIMLKVLPLFCSALPWSAQESPSCSLRALRPAGK